MKEILTDCIEWFANTIRAIDAWLTSVFLYIWQAIKSAALFAHEWLTSVFVLIKQGNTDSLPVDEILLALVITTLGLALIYRVAITIPAIIAWCWYRIDHKAHQLAGIDPPEALRLRLVHSTPARRAKVMREGRWSVYGYEEPWDAEKRRKAWKGKLMTPQQQRMHIARVQEEERRHTQRKRGPAGEGYDSKAGLDS